MKFSAFKKVSKQPIDRLEEAKGVRLALLVPRVPNCKTARLKFQLKLLWKITKIRRAPHKNNCIVTTVLQTKRNELVQSYKIQGLTVGAGV